MENETKAMLRATIRALSGFCTETAPEEYLQQLFAALLEGDVAKAKALAEEANGWVREWEKETYEE